MTTTILPAIPTRDLIDRMIDQAQDDNLLASYVIVLGHAPASSRAKDDLGWLHGHKIYRRFKVVQSGEIPFEAVLLSPTADNYQAGEVSEYKGLLDSGRIVRRILYP